MIDLQVRPLTVSDRASVAVLFADDGGYAERVHGRGTTPQDVDDMFNARPPASAPEQKHAVGLWGGADLVGVADLLVDFPKIGTNYLGLLQIRADHQGQGLAARFRRELMELFPGARVWRLSVVNTNSDVVGFWQRMGYNLTGETRQWTSPSGASREALIMERTV